MSSVKYEALSTGDDAVSSCFGATWRYQTFTPAATHKATSVKFLLYRANSPGTITVGIRATDGAGKPTGADLTSGTSNGDTLTDVSPGEWREITFSAAYYLTAGTKYAYVIRISGDNPNILWIRAVDDPGGYAGGNGGASTDSGSSWTAIAADYLFEDWGQPALSGTAAGTGTLTGALTITNYLLNTQQLSSYKPLAKVVLTKSGETTYTYYNYDRLLMVSHVESDDSYTAQIAISNYDNALTDVDLRGYTATISWGATTSVGDKYSSRAGLTVLYQQYSSIPGDLYCTLTCIGITDNMARQGADSAYLPASGITDTLKDAIVGLLGNATNYGYNVYGAAATLVWDSEDSVIDSFVIKNYLKIYKGTSRLSNLNELLGYSKEVKRLENDNKIHFLNPTVSGTTYAYTYNLEGVHPFYTKSFSRTIVIPNQFLVIDPTSSYTSGVISDATSSLMIEYRIYTLPVTSNDEATAIANAMLQRAQLNSQRAAFLVPMNFFQKVWDYIQVNDTREGGSARTGNVQYIKRVWEARSGKFQMEIQFGNPSAVIPDASTGVKELTESKYVEETGGYATESYVIEQLSKLAVVIELLANRVLALDQTTVDTRIDDALNSGDATTDGVIDAIRDALIAQNRISAS